MLRPRDCATVQILAFGGGVKGCHLMKFQTQSKVLREPLLWGEDQMVSLS